MDTYMATAYAHPVAGFRAPGPEMVGPERSKTGMEGCLGFRV